MNSQITKMMQVLNLENPMVLWAAIEQFVSLLTMV